MTTPPPHLDPPDSDAEPPSEAHKAKRQEKPSDELDELRSKIDQLDTSIIDLLSERAQVVVHIGKQKQSDHVPIYAPHREHAVLKKVLANNPGPLSDRTIEAIYRELMSGSFSLEQPLRVAYLGPPGTFSHVAAVGHFGSSVTFIDHDDIDNVFNAVASGQCDYGLAPYENTIGGGITDTLDALQTHEVSIYAESMIEVVLCLLCNGAPDQIRQIASKPQAISQCRHWLAAHYSRIDRIEMTSTAAAVKAAASDSSCAAVGSALAGDLYGVKTIFERIQDKVNNVTRFLILSREEARPSGEDKTTLMFVTAHKPGALVDVLAVFRDAGINLSHIDKRPSGRVNWEWTFFIDLEGHREDAKVAEAIKAAEVFCISMRVLGSYPRAEYSLTK